MQHRLLTLVLPLSLALSPEAEAQLGSGSRSFTLLGPELRSALPEATSPNYAVAVQLTELESEAASSTHFGFQPGTLTLPAGLDPLGPPIVLALEDGPLDPLGGTSALLRGQRLGSGAATVELGGSSVAGSAVTPTTLTFLAPTALDAVGNPLAPTALTVIHTSGTGTAHAAAVFSPSLELLTPASVGRDLTLRVRADSGQLVFVATGASLPGVAFPVAPFAGALELVVAPTILAGPLPVTDGEVCYSIPIPPSGTAGGATFEFQAAAYDPLAPFTSRFTSRLEVHVAP